ncbi:MAG TPA: zf-HC2 domain-containing protein [Candidatus Polarisedimenticolia bacterium]|nr:zf-HC2 domain-containing protein [Candidatus Polarisedimenticolia bacterium]
MTPRDEIARLIPWYAAGTLDRVESEQVEAHLSGCDDCRDLLVVARGFRRLAPETPTEALFDHVQSQRLVEFAADPAALEPDARRFVTEHIRTCALCAEALEILEDLGRAPASDEGGGAIRTGTGAPLEKIWLACREVWRRLSRTLLRPLPALVYLTALLVALVSLPLRPPAPGTTEPGTQTPGGRPVVQPPPVPAPTHPRVMLLPPAIDLPGEVVFRGGQPPPAPVVVPLRGGAEVIPLSLVTGIDREDLEDPAAAFRVTITQGERSLLDADRTAGDFDRRGRLVLLLDPAAVTAGVPCQVQLFLKKPGDRRDGEEIYRRSFVLAAGDAAAR